MSSSASWKDTPATQRALPSHARRHNLSLVLRSLFHRGATTRAGLAHQTGLTRVTTSELVAQLIADGLVVELGTRAPSGPGKPGVLVDLYRTGLHVVTMDLSGEHEYRGAVMTLDGAVVTRRAIARDPVLSRAGSVRSLLQLARELIEACTGRILGIGIGSPGVVSAEGAVIVAPNVGWEGTRLQEIFHEEFSLPVVVRNDANAAAMAEYTLGDAEPDMLLITIDKGVGGAVMLDGKLVAGRYSAAGEVGHVPVGDRSDGPLCACGKRGCLEAWIAAPRLTAMIEETGNPEKVLREAGERLGAVIAPVVAALNLSDVVVVAPASLRPGLLDSALRTLQDRTLGRFHTQVRMREPTDCADIVLRGALVMVLDSELGVT